MKRSKKPTTYTVLVERERKEDGGGYVVTVPALRPVVTQGNTLREVRQNVRDAISGCIKTMRDHGETIPRDRRPPGRLARGARLIRVRI